MGTLQLMPAKRPDADIEGRRGAKGEHRAVQPAGDSRLAVDAHRARPAMEAIQVGAHESHRVRLRNKKYAGEKADDPGDPRCGRKRTFIQHAILLLSQV
jgi:hypothetical protein